MKKYLPTLLFLVCVLTLTTAQVKIGGSGSPHINSVLELDGGSDKGLLLPRHTNAEMNAMINTPDGLMIYNTTNKKAYISRAGTWEVAEGINLPHDKNYTVDGNFILKLLNQSANTAYGAIMGQSVVGKGVVGSSTSGTGIGGLSTSGTGVLGTSSSSLGVYGYSSTGTGIYAASGSGAALITGTGNVGIGATYPVVPLHVLREQANLLLLENSLSLGTGMRSDLIFKTGTYYTGVISTVGNSASTARIAFYTGANTTPGSLYERMSILNNGNVGIGITAPNTKLEVWGTSRFNVSGTDDAMQVYGEAVFTQTGGAEAAVTINGRIKTSGANPRAFIVTVPYTTSELILDHPDLNNNPNAIILVTARWAENTPMYKGTLVVQYKQGTGKWALRAGGDVVNAMAIVDIEACNGGCWSDTKIPSMVSPSFHTWDSFNVLVIGN